VLAGGCVDYEFQRGRAAGDKPGYTFGLPLIELNSFQQYRKSKRYLRIHATDIAPFA